MARYTPANPPTQAADLASFLRDELGRIAQALDTSDTTLALDTLYAPPPKFREGTLAKADGTIWNPGSGAGVYCFRAGSWRFLG